MLLEIIEWRGTVRDARRIHRRLGVAIAQRITVYGC